MYLNIKSKKYWWVNVFNALMFQFYKHPTAQLVCWRVWGV